MIRVSLRCGLLSLPRSRPRQPIRRHVDRMKGFYASLPEADRTREDRKSRAAFQLRDWNEASRLLGVVLAGEPSSPSIAAALVRAMALGGQKKQALKVLGDALVKNPDRAELIALKKRIEAGVPADLEHDDPAAAAGDPLARALLEARTALARAMPPELANHSIRLARSKAMIQS